MNLNAAIHAVRRYGIKGIINYLLRKAHPADIFHLIREQTGDAPPVPGITIIGPMDCDGSLSKVLRDLARLLKSAGIPFQALNAPGDHPIPDSEYLPLITPPDAFVSNKYTHIITMRQTYPIRDKRCVTHAIEFWEFEDGFKEAQPEILWIKDIIAMSDFNYDVFKKNLPNSNVRKILYPFQFEHGPLAPIEAVRKKYGIPTDAFMIFFNFDYNSSYYRKNPEGLLRAFREAFSPTDNAVLVFKTMHAKACPTTQSQLNALAKELSVEQKIIPIDNFIPQEDLVNLTNACDVYASLHRGEGFGLGIAEAMSLAKPVIVTDYSSTTEFCNAENAMLIPCELVKVKPEQKDVEVYKHVSRWAEPDIHAAAAALRKLYDEPDLRTKLGTNAQKFIAKYFSVENFRKSIKAFLES